MMTSASRLQIEFLLLAIWHFNASALQEVQKKANIHASLRTTWRFPVEWFALMGES